MMTIILYTLKDLKNANSWLIYSIATTPTIETPDADYENFLLNLDVTNTVRCGRLVKHCAL